MEDCRGRTIHLFIEGQVERGINWINGLTMAVLCTNIGFSGAEYLNLRRCDSVDECDEQIKQRIVIIIIIIIIITIHVPIAVEGRSERTD
jgi:hypothetical protein